MDATLSLTLERGYRPVDERRYRRKDGSVVEVEIGASVIRDVTERKRAEAAMGEIREAERARVGRDLPDGPLQDLAYGLVEVHIAGMAVGDGHPGSAAATIARASEALGRMAGGLRAAVNDLRLGGERDRSLPALVEALAERERSMDPELTIGLEVREGFPAGPGAAPKPRSCAWSVRR